MSVQIYKNNAILMAKIESTYGTDPVPTESANALLVRNLSVNPMEGSAADLEYIRPFYGQDASLRTSTFVTLDFDTDWVPGTGSAGSASPFDTLFRACGMAATQLGAAATGTAQTGSTTTTIKLAAGASATNDVYRGATITLTGGTGSGQSAYITDYNGSTKVATVRHVVTAGGVQQSTWATTPDATTTYSIGANMAYDPVSSSFQSTTLYINYGGVLHKILGARGSFSLSLAANEIPSIKFNFTGLYGGITDTAIATPTYTGFGTPVAVNSSNTKGHLFGKLLTGGSSGIQLQSFSLDMANSTNYRQLVGSESVVLSDRKPKGSVSIEMTTVAFYDWFGTVKNGTTGYLGIQNGSAAGQTVRIDMPKVQLENPRYSESDGIVMLDMDLRAIWTVGNDEVRLVEK